MAEEHCEAHRGQAKLDQQGIQAHRDRERKAGGDAGEPQRSERNSESGSRGDQDSPRGPVARGRIDGQKTRATSCLRRTQSKFESSNNKNWLSGEEVLRRDWLDGHDTGRRRRSPAGRWKHRDPRKKCKQRRGNSKRRSRKNPP